MHNLENNKLQLNGIYLTDLNSVRRSTACMLISLMGHKYQVQ